MIRNSVELYSGYIQVHRAGYWEDKSINNMMEITDSLEAAINSTPHVDFYIPRLETFVLAASRELSKGVVVVGTAPQEEDRMTKLASKVIDGEYIRADTRGVMLAEGLADYLQLRVADTIVMIGQGFHGANAVDQYPVTAIVRFPNPQQNDNTVYAPIALMQEFASAPDLCTALVLSIDNLKKQDEIKKHLTEVAGPKYEVMDWQEMQPELVQLIQSDNAGGVILLGILYVVIAFGIFGTVMMMSIERRREFGVMVAVGMRKGRLSVLVILETLMIGFLGLAISLVIGILLLIYMYHHPIPMSGDAALAMKEMGIEPLLPFSLDPVIFTSQMLAIIVIVMICLLYPLFNIVRLRPINALRH